MPNTHGPIHESRKSLPPIKFASQPGAGYAVAVAPPAPGEAQTAIRILRLPEVMARIGICRASIYNKMTEGLFPQPIHLGPRAVGWLESEINTWLAARIQERHVNRT